MHSYMYWLRKSAMNFSTILYVFFFRCCLRCDYACRSQVCIFLPTLTSTPCLSPAFPFVGTSALDSGIYSVGLKVVGGFCACADHLILVMVNITFSTTSEGFWVGLKTLIRRGDCGGLRRGLGCAIVQHLSLVCGQLGHGSKFPPS